jgi:hypothetical protein
MARRKHVDLKTAKAAKQKKIAIGGAVLLLGLLAFSVPKTLKMLHHTSSTSAAAKTTTTHATPVATGARAVQVSSTPAGVTVLTAQLAPAAREGQLSVLSASFKSKDPFHQLVEDAAAGDSAAPTDTTATKPAKPEVSLKVVPSTKTGPTAPAATAGHKIALSFLSAVISVNGVRGGVNVKVDFPADAPLFHLVSLTKKTAKISVAGGSLANGSETLTLRRGKPLTLVNTADGTRYRLVLVTTSKAAAVAQTQSPGTTSPGAATPTDTSTTTTETTTTPTIGG